jgi:hypothetical protein
MDRGHNGWPTDVDSHTKKVKDPAVGRGLSGTDDCIINFESLDAGQAAIDRTEGITDCRAQY